MSKLLAATLVLVAGLSAAQAQILNNPDAATSFHASDGRLRASKVIGATVYNDTNQKIGTVDDVLLPGSPRVSGQLMVVISVGGFLSVGSKLVAVPFATLQIDDEKVVMPGASRAALNKMPTYQYDAS
jgi:hypothetical protein